MARVRQPHDVRRAQYTIAEHQRQLVAKFSWIERERTNANNTHAAQNALKRLTVFTQTHRPIEFHSKRSANERMKQTYVHRSNVTWLPCSLCALHSTLFVFDEFRFDSHRTDLFSAIRRVRRVSMVTNTQSPIPKRRRNLHQSQNYTAHCVHFSILHFIYFTFIQNT